MTPYDSTLDSMDGERQAARIAELEAHLARLTADVTDLASALAATATGDASERPEDPAPVYNTVNDWVEHYFCTVFARSIGGEFRWCPRWTDHPEATTRLTALWRSWETLRLDPNLGIATWLTGYADPQLPILLSRTGPFAQCTVERHQTPQNLPAGEPESPPMLHP